MSFRRMDALLAAMGLLLFGMRPARALPSMSLGTTAGAPGATVSVPVNVTIDTNVVSLQFDLWYSTNYLTNGAPVGGNALSDQQIYYAPIAPGALRVLA